MHSVQVTALRAARTVTVDTGAAEAVRCDGSQRSAGRIIAAACLLSGPSPVDHCAASIAGLGLVRLGQKHTWVACCVSGFILSL